MTKLEFIKFFNENIYTSLGRVRGFSNRKNWWINRNFYEIYCEILKRTKFLDNSYSMTDRVHCIINDIVKFPKCQYENCNEIVNVKQIFCNSKCANSAEKVKNIIKQTHFKKTGYDNPSKNPNIIKLKKEQYFKKTGYYHQMQNPVTKEKHIQTTLRNLGVKYPMQNLNVKQKSVVTCLERYNCENISQNLDVKKKKESTHFSKTGFRYHLQNPSKLHEHFVKTHRYKDYKMPSGKVVKVQGYEPRILDLLFEMGYEEHELIVETKNVPRINYVYNAQNHIYFPDIFIPKDNLIIEVKSTYTFEINKEVNLAKRKAVISKGYDFKFYIL